MDLTEHPHVALEPTILERWGGAGEKESLSCCGLGVQQDWPSQADREVAAV